jgi:hypothetical protein
MGIRGITFYYLIQIILREVLQDKSRIDIVL